ncbi:MAG: thioredoxin-dependent thiol peroxidase [Saprospiraceae bacterium]|nr:thioredoxin-dependent thiol peroxidase [Saprospiraceae bacterium]
MTTSLKEGQKAPDFTGVNEKGEKVSLSDYKGKKLILYFYPKDDTPGCTKEACSLRDDYADLKKAGYEILGVSPDKEAKHQKFIEKYNLPFSLIADTEKEILEAYDVYGTKMFMGKEVVGVRRTTFVIDEKGVIEKIITKVKTKEHGQQIMEEMGMTA